MCIGQRELWFSQTFRPSQYYRAHVLLYFKLEAPIHKIKDFFNLYKWGFKTVTLYVDCGVVVTIHNLAVDKQLKLS